MRICAQRERRSILLRTPSRIGACTLPVIAHSNTAAALDAVDAQASSSNTITAATMGRTRPTIGNKQ